jgi:hypothetical protein
LGVGGDRRGLRGRALLQGGLLCSEGGEEAAEEGSVGGHGVVGDLLVWRGSWPVFVHQILGAVFYAAVQSPDYEGGVQTRP